MVNHFRGWVFSLIVCLITFDSYAAPLGIPTGSPKPAPTRTQRIQAKVNQSPRLQRFLARKPVRSVVNRYNVRHLKTKKAALEAQSTALKNKNPLEDALLNFYRAEKEYSQALTGSTPEIVRRTELLTSSRQISGIKDLYQDTYAGQAGQAAQGTVFDPLTAPLQQAGANISEGKAKVGLVVGIKNAVQKVKEQGVIASTKTAIGEIKQYKEKRTPVRTRDKLKGLKTEIETREEELIRSYAILKARLENNGQDIQREYPRYVAELNAKLKRYPNSEKWELKGTLDHLDDVYTNQSVVLTSTTAPVSQLKLESQAQREEIIRSLAALAESKHKINEALNGTVNQSSFGEPTIPLTPSKPSGWKLGGTFEVNTQELRRDGDLRTALIKARNSANGDERQLLEKLLSASTAATLDGNRVEAQKIYNYATEKLKKNPDDRLMQELQTIFGGHAPDRPDIGPELSKKQGAAPHNTASPVDDDAVVEPLANPDDWLKQGEGPIMQKRASQQGWVAWGREKLWGSPTSFQPSQSSSRPSVPEEPRPESSRLSPEKRESQLKKPLPARPSSSSRPGSQEIVTPNNLSMKAQAFQKGNSDQIILELSKIRSGDLNTITAFGKLQRGETLGLNEIRSLQKYTASALEKVNSRNEPQRKAFLDSLQAYVDSVSP